MGIWGELRFSEFSGGKAKKRGGGTKKLKSRRGKKEGGNVKKSRIWWGEQTLEDTMDMRFRLKNAQQFPILLQITNHLPCNEQSSNSWHTSRSISRTLAHPSISFNSEKTPVRLTRHKA